MIEETKTNSRVTSFHSKVMIGLTAAIVFLGVITLLTNRNTPGRYAMSGSTSAGIVIDTKISQLWLRTAAVTVDLGTNENPNFEQIKPKQKNRLAHFEPKSPNAFEK